MSTEHDKNKQDAKTPEVYAARTDVGCVREHNEDSFIAATPLFVVADGMGGHEAGEVASEIAIRTMLEKAPNSPDGDALANAVKTANVAIISAASAGMAVGSPVRPLAMSAQAFISSKRSRLLLDAAESVPRHTFIPAFTMPITSAQPEASLRLLTGQCTADTRRLASKAISSGVTCTQCAAVTRVSSTWWQSNSCAGVSP